MRKRKTRETQHMPTEAQCDALTCDCIEQCKRIYPPKGVKRASSGRIVTTFLKQGAGDAK
jgi:hypothetical protein